MKERNLKILTRLCLILFSYCFRKQVLRACIDFISTLSERLLTLAKEDQDDTELKREK